MWEFFENNFTLSQLRKETALTARDAEAVFFLANNAQATFTTSLRVAKQSDY